MHLMTCLLEKKLKMITFTKFIRVLQGAPFSLVIRHRNFRHRPEKKKKSVIAKFGKEEKNFSSLADLVKTPLLLGH